MTTDPTRAAEIVVEQRHRDAASRWLAHNVGDSIPLVSLAFDRIPNGKADDHSLVQAFARFERDHMQRPTDTARAGEGVPSISDDWIAERWPDQDAAEVRRRFDALMDKIGETPWRGMPRFPETMQPVLAWAAMLPTERIEVLTAALAEVPEHFRDYHYVAEKPRFGVQRVKMMSVAGDDGHGMGRQAIAITPYVKGYNIAPWIAAASPGNVGALLAELQRLRAATPSPVTDEAALSTEAVKRVQDCWSAVKREFGQSFRDGSTSTYPEIIDMDAALAALASTPQPASAETDARLLDVLRDESWDLRCFSVPTGGGDADIGWRVIGHWMAEPCERVMGEVFHDDPRAAIRAAIRQSAKGGE
jgi:hypothetical protein